jgi:uncharacterized protein (DUF1778 family)
MSATKTRRLEMRADPDSSALIAQAAQLVGLSLSAFILQAATEEASRVIARVNHAVMPADQFDALLSSLDRPDDAPKIAEASTRRRRFIRHE